MKHFNLMTNAKKLVLVGAVLFGFNANAQSVYDVISSSSDHTTLKAAIDEANLSGALSDPNADLTVFAPTNTAFATLLGELGLTPSELLANPDLSNILLYHVLGSEVKSTSLVNGTFATTLEGDSVFVSLTANGTFIDQAEVIGNEIDADNGVVHVINDVILAQNSLIDVAVSNGSFTILSQAIVKSGLAPALIDPMSELTVFAPTDAAFIAFLDEIELTAQELLDDEDLANILLYHVIGSAIESGDLTNASFATTLEGDSVFVSLLSTGNFIDQAEILITDVEADNGFIHVIDDVLLAQNSIVDVAVSNGFSILTQAVVTTELAPTLVDPLAGLTVFAPTDNAFTSLLNDLGISTQDLLEREDLKDILLYHVVSGVVESADVENGLYITTVQGDSSIISVIDGEGYIDQAMITNFDVEADNGIIHIINDVILPQNSIIDVAVSNGFSILTEAVVTSGLVPALVDPLSELTVFAPTDAAFADLLTELDITAADLLAREDLADILLYHVLGNKVASGDLNDGQVVETLLAGESIIIDLTNGVKINTSTVELADVTTDNGIVHVIGKVLLPNSITSIADNSLTVIELYPNPTTEFINVTTPESGLTFSITNEGGMNVMNGTLNNGKNTLSINNLTTGVHFITLTTNETSKTLKFVKN